MSWTRFNASFAVVSIAMTSYVFAGDTERNDTHLRTSHLIDVRTEGQRDGQTDGRTDGQKDRRADSAVLH